METSLGLLLSLCLIGFSSLSLYFYYVTWLRPESIRNKLRRQGIAGPPPSFPYGNLPEMKRVVMAEEARREGGRGGGMNHDYTSKVFPYFEQWRKEYGMKLLLSCYLFLTSQFFFFSANIWPVVKNL